jgi:hypothetical protein
MSQRIAPTQPPRAFSGRLTETKGPAIEALGVTHGARLSTIGHRFEDGGLVKGLQH